MGWYYGNISVAEAERLLKEERNGAFLVRDSSDSGNRTDLFTIIFKTQDRYGSVRVELETEPNETCSDRARMMQKGLKFMLQPDC